MEEFSYAVKAICAASAAVCLIEYTTAGSCMKRQIKMLLDLIMAVIILTPFVRGTVTFELPELRGISPPRQEEAAELYKEQLCRQTAENIGAVLHQQIAAVGVKCESVGIEVNISDDGSICINRVTISTEDFAAAAEIVRNSLGSDTEVLNGDP